MTSDAASPTALALLAVGMLTPLATAGALLLTDAEWQAPLTIGGLVLLWGCAVGVVMALRRRPGIRFVKSPLMTRGDLGIAVLAGIGGALLVPLLSLGIATLLGETGTAEAAGSAPLLLLIAGVVTAAVTEEVLFRAVPMELMLRRRMPRWLVVLLPWAAFVVTHLGNWNLAHVVGVVAPLGLIMGLLYLWRRNLLVVIIAHLLIDAPLIVLALAG